ncbi:MAG: response regulator, partial [Magnetococcales bacterium]|nr:response regulator [Magnetococcales bacterium]
STFSFEIPMDVREGSRERYEANDYSELSQANCLLLTVSPASEQSLQEMMESAGGYLTSRSDHDGFVSELEQAAERGKPYDLVIVDAPEPFPGMDGLDYAGHLRDREGCEALPILVLIRGLDRSDMDQAGRMGVGLINKPAKRVELMEAVTCLMGGGDASPLEGKACARASVEPVEIPQLKILLAEDSDDNAALMEAYLRPTAHLVERVENGREAVEMVKSDRFDLVLMDSQMPEMDGFSAACAIRQWERGQGGRSQVRIIALTASVQREDRRRSIECGCDCHLIKPIKRDVLLREIERLFT